MTWTEKYRPKVLSDMIGMTDEITIMHTWMKQYICEVSNKSKIPAPGKGVKRGLLLVGAPGVGKTTMARMFLEYYGYSFIEINGSEKVQALVFKDQLNSISYFGRSRDSKPLAIIIDEADGLETGDKGCITTLIQFLNPLRKSKRGISNKDKIMNDARWTPPVICISNLGHSKKIGELSDDTCVINCKKPSEKCMFELANSIRIKENLNLTRDQLIAIVKASQNDMRRMINIMQAGSVRVSVGVNSGTGMSWSVVKRVELAQKVSSEGTDLPLTIIYNGNYTNPADFLRLYNLSNSSNIKKQIHMSIHGNYGYMIMNQKIAPIEKLNKLVKCINWITRGDVFDRMKYGGPVLDMSNDIYALTSIYLPIREITRHKIENSPIGIQSLEAFQKFQTYQNNMSAIRKMDQQITAPRFFSPEELQIICNQLTEMICSKEPGERQRGEQLMEEYGLQLAEVKKVAKSNIISPPTEKVIKELQKYHLASKKAIGVKKIVLTLPPLSSVLSEEAKIMRKVELQMTG